jgi:hypothetical protein
MELKSGDSVWVSKSVLSRCLGRESTEDLKNEWYTGLVIDGTSMVDVQVQITHDKTVDVSIKRDELLPASSPSENGKRFHFFVFSLQLIFQSQFSALATGNAQNISLPMFG